VYPALAVLQELDDDTLELLWVGGEGGMEEDLVTRAGFEITTLPAAGLHGVGLRALPGNLLQLWRGFWAARRLLRSFQPDALFFTGGYVAAPVAIAGRQIPTLAFVPDIKPGFALRLVARFADRIAVVSDASRQYFKRPERVRVTGYPLRKELAKWNRGVARAHLGLSPDLPVLLVFGGSKGARSINQALITALPQLLKHVQIVHVSGQLSWTEVEEAARSLPEHLAARYHAFPYLHNDMGAALAAADLVVSRAGASTLGEFPLFGLPAILVPIPFEQHLQHLNAAYLEKRGAALILKDSEMADHLVATVLSLLQDDSRREQMAQAMSRLAVPKAANKIAALLRELGNSRKESVQP
jgi:UDP-N-acetylglucosamine--N-acetylmuramyl-(pentapeptide) pyrophosphoryl-undecaprenol N-acetylglucosamine transferase